MNLHGARPYTKPLTLPRRSGYVTMADLFELVLGACQGYGIWSVRADAEPGTGTLLLWVTGESSRQLEYYLRDKLPLGSYVEVLEDKRSPGPPMRLPEPRKPEPEPEPFKPQASYYYGKETSPFYKNLLRLQLTKEALDRKVIP